MAVFYSLFIAMVIYRSVRWRDLLPILSEAAVTSSVVMFIVVFAGIFSWAASTTGIIDAAANAIIDASPNALVTVLLVNVMLLVLGMFLDAISISYLVMPILLPVLKAFGLDPVWYGVVFITALAIGQITPPVGVNLATVSKLAGTDMDSVSKKLLPYVGVNVAVLVILTLSPPSQQPCPHGWGSPVGKVLASKLPPSSTSQQQKPFNRKTVQDSSSWTDDTQWAHLKHCFLNEKSIIDKEKLPEMISLVNMDSIYSI